MRAAVMLSFITLVACSGAQRRPDTVLYASGAELQSINPLVTVHPMAKQVQKFLLFTTLVRYDEALEPQPYLARQWRWTSNRRVVEFTLARSVAWHDGTPTTARDVVWTLRAAMAPETGYPRAASLRQMQTVDAVDSYTVRVRFDRPQSSVPDVLTDLPILPAHLLETTPHNGMRTAAFNRRPVGNGPFRFVRHEPNLRWVFGRNEQFSPELGGPPRLERFIVAIVDEATTKLAALTAGELDVAGINPAHADFVRRTPYLEVRDYPVLFTNTLIFNLRRPPFDDSVVREAVALALDREALVDSYVYGFGEAGPGLIPGDHPLAVKTSVDEMRVDSARVLLARAGYTGGRRLEFELLTVASGENALEQLIQAQLNRIGVRVVIRALELGAFLSRAQAAQRSFEAMVIGIPGDLELSHLRGLLDSRQAQDPLHYAGYEAEAMDRALDAGDWAEVERLVRRDRPLVVLYHARGVQGAARRLRGAVMDLRGELPTVAEWYLDERAAGPR